MIKVAFLAIGIFITNFAVGQSFTIPELIKIYNSNNSDAETIILNKGYEFIEAETTDIKKSLIFSFNPSKSDRNFSNHVIFVMDYNFGGRGVSFQTQKKDYVAAKNYCSINGYKHISTDNKTTSITTVYKNKSWVIEFEAFQNKTQGGDEITSYLIKLSKP